MENAFSYLASMNWQTIIAMFAIGWFFTKDIRDTLIKLDDDIRNQGKRTDRLYEMFCDLQNQMKNEMYDMKKELVQMRREHYEFIHNNHHERHL